MHHKKQVENSLKILIKKEGLDETAIREKIAIAISLVLKSNHINYQDLLSKIHCDIENPTIDEITDYLIIELSKSE